MPRLRNTICGGGTAQKLLGGSAASEPLIDDARGYTRHWSI